MKSKHTPGPWTVAENDSCCIMAKGRHIATAYDSDGGRSETGRGARNAALIAAAPELFECLNHLFNECRIEVSPDWNDKIYKTLHKAIGGEK